MMKKSLIISVFSIFVLVSCGLPLSHNTPDPNLIATLVAETLSIVPTVQSTLSGSSLPTVALNTLSPSLTPTLTPTPTPDTDPKASLGSPLFVDTFTNGVAFGLPYEDSAVLIHVDNGAMVFNSYQVKAGRRWSLTPRTPRNLYLEGNFTTGNCSGNDNYGLVMRAPTYSSGVGYYVGLTCGGNYFLDRWDSSGDATVLDGTPDNHINAGANKSNRLGVKVVDSKFSIYINGVLVKELTDGDLTAKGNIGAFISARETSSFSVRLEDISVWELP
jgi:hypothetical protein